MKKSLWNHLHRDFHHSVLQNWPESASHHYQSNAHNSEHRPLPEVVARHVPLGVPLVWKISVSQFFLTVMNTWVYIRCNPPSRRS